MENTEKPSQYNNSGKDRETINSSESISVNNPTFTQTRETTLDTKQEEQEDESSVSAKAKQTGSTLKDLIAAIGRKTKAVTEEKTSQLKEAANSPDPTIKDAADIQKLGSHIDGIIEIFDNTMASIRQQQPYEEQEKLLVGFKKVILEEINVINARLSMVKRLKLVEEKTKTTANTTTTTNSSSTTIRDSDVLEQKLQERRIANTLDTEAAAIPLNDTEDKPIEGEEPKGFIA
jgi:metal-sulfur cluster biosynthetic enzyme